MSDSSSGHFDDVLKSWTDCGPRNQRKSCECQCLLGSWAYLLGAEADGGGFQAPREAIEWRFWQQVEVDHAQCDYAVHCDPHLESDGFRSLGRVAGHC